MVTTELNSHTSPLDKCQAFLAQQLSNAPSSFVHFDRADVEQPIHARFEQIVGRYPNNIAIATPKWSLTYDQLNRRANQIAQTLLSRLGPEPIQVGFTLPNDGQAIPTILGILKAGKSYVPLDPHFPKERLSYMAKDAQVSLLLTNDEEYALAAELGPKEMILSLDDIDKNSPVDNPGLYCDPLALAYILYTSGSTGRPKGIAFGHRNLLHTSMCLINSLCFSPEDSLTQLHSTSFAASVVDIYCALMTGATVCPWDVKRRGFVGLADWLRAERVTSFQWIPTPFRHFMETLGADEQLPDIRLVVMASEPLTAREMHLHRRHFSAGSVLVNQMGTSESYNYSLFLIDQNATIDSYIMPAGYSVSEEREVLILDEAHQPVESGAKGEIAIQTEYMSLGYWKKPIPNAEKFLPDPTNRERKIYLTGDLGRFLPDGCLMHEGRKDFQIKVRGYRIEISEIEKALVDIPNVQDALVVATENPNGEMQLVAYIIPAQSEKLESKGNNERIQPTDGFFCSPLLDADEIQSALKVCLPDYMIPSQFWSVNRFPTTATGKIDRMQLPTLSLPPVQQSVPTVEKDLPQTKSEHQLLHMWCKLLGRDSITIHERFFDLGGHSLIAARMFFEIERDLGVRIPLSTLFHAQSIHELAQVIDGESRPATWSSLTPIQPKGSKPPLYIVHAHGGNVLGYYELAQYLAPDQPFYGIQAKGLDGRSLESRTFEEMARAYVEEIRSFQPNGPYYLSGYCFGGNMAFAMSQHLRRAGEDVAFLAMIDSGHQLYPKYPTELSPLEKIRAKWTGRLAYEWHSATKVGMRSVWPHLSGRFAQIVTRLQIKGERFVAERGSIWGISSTPSQAFVQHQLEEIHEQAFLGYKVEPYDGDVLLFRAEHQPLGIIPDETMGWRDSVLGKLETYELPGYSVGLLDEPRIQNLARIFNNRLEEAQRRALEVS